MTVDNKTWNMINDRKRWLDAWLKEREYDIGDKRRKYIRIYYCTAKNVMDVKYARIKVLNINKKFKDPLSEEDIYENVFYPVDDAEIIPKLTNRDIIKKLGITKSEEDKLQIGVNMKQRKEGEKRNKIKTSERNKRNREMINDYMIYDMNYKSLSEKYSLSMQQIKNILQPYSHVKKSRRNERIIWLFYEWELSKAEVARCCRCGRDVVYKVLKEYEEQLKEKSVGKDNSLLELVTTRYEKETITLVDSKLQETFCSYKSAMEHGVVDEQAIALEVLQNSNRNIFLKGDGGTGKTKLLYDYLETLSLEQRQNIMLLAPTGLSASHIGGITIHKALSLPCDVIPDEPITETPKKLINTELIVLDEVSMVRMDVFNHLCKVIKYIETTEHRCIRLLIIGDYGQSQPILTTEDMIKFKEFYPNAKGIHAFDSIYWDSMNFEIIQLTYVHRQDNQELINKLREIKFGVIEAIEWFNKNCDHIPDEDAIYIVPTNKLVKKYNSKALEKFQPNDFVTFNATCKGDIQEQDIPTDKRLDLAVGMRVMTIINTKYYKNGNIGTITKINKKSVRVLLDNGKEVLVQQNDFHIDENCVFRQLPLCMAHAITANKSEGITLDKVNIVPGFFSPNLLYVALSRCKSLENIHIIGKLSVKDLHVDRRALEMAVQE